MTMGGGIALMVIGAILAFAIKLQNSFVDLDLVGWILTIAGFVVFVIGLALLLRRRQSVTTARVAVDPVSGERVSQRVSESAGR